MKKYKPGQFVSIGGKLARVYRRNPAFHVCDCCEAANGKCPCKYHAFKKVPINIECTTKLGWYYYPKLIKQC